jgi:hypothetical protein
MVRLAWALAAAVVNVAGCGGHLTTGEHPDQDRTDAASADAQVADARNPYIPSDGSPIVDDADPAGGVTDLPGEGFDFCSSRTPGDVSIDHTTPSSQGDGFLRFRSSAGCQGRCSRQNPSDAQVFAWPKATSFDVVTGLYFDIVDLGATPSTGIMTIYGTDEACGANFVITYVPLTALAPRETWSTRCISVRPGIQKAIGIAITGGSYDIGIDAIRFGQYCH